MRRSRLVRSTKGANISAAKKGKRQVQLAEDELTLDDARKERIANREELLDGIKPGPDGQPRLRHRREPVPGGRQATIFRRRWLLVDLAAMRTDGSRRSRAGKAKRRAAKARLVAQGAVALTDAAASRSIPAGTLAHWAHDHSESAFRGPYRAWFFRSDAELDAELKQWRCACCADYALLSESKPKRCKSCSSAVQRAGKLTATEFAEKYRERGVDARSLVERLEADEIPGKRVHRSGRHAWLLDEPTILAMLEEHFRCQWHKGCTLFGLGPTRHCSDHAGAAARIAGAAGMVTVVCDPEAGGCGEIYEHYPSQIRQGPLCHKCNLGSPEFADLRLQSVNDTWGARYLLVEECEEDGLARRRSIADDLGLASTTSLYALSKHGATEERQVVLGVPFGLLKHAEHARIEQLRSEPKARTAQKLERERRRLIEAGVITTIEQQSALEERFIVRSRWMQRLSPGAPQKPQKAKEKVHAEWARLYDELVSWWQEREELDLLAGRTVRRVPGPLKLCLTIAALDHGAAPKRWSCNPADQPKRTARRVWMAIKRHRARR